jgi:Flp pilus assembly protein TadD
MFMTMSLFISACANKTIDQELSSEALHQEQAIQSQYQQAIDHMKTAQGSSDEPIEGGSLKGNETLQLAHTVLQAIHELKPYYPGPILNLGVCSWWLGDYEEAETYLKKVLSLEALLDEAAENKSLLQGDKDRIKDNLVNYTGPALKYLGQMSREQGNFEKAEKFYRQALAKKTEDKGAIRNLAILLDLYQGKLAEALPLYEQYQSLLEEPDPQVKDWIFDLKNRL